MTRDEAEDFNRRLVGHLLSSHEKTNPMSNKSWAKGAGEATRQLKIDLAEHFVLDKDFLGAFTKSGIDAILREAVNGKGVAFVAHYENQDGGNTLAALMKKKSDEIMEAVFGCGYDFTGFVPACVARFIGDGKASGQATTLTGTPETTNPTPTPPNKQVAETVGNDNPGDAYMDYFDLDGATQEPAFTEDFEDNDDDI